MTLASSARRAFVVRSGVILALAAFLYLPSVWNRDLWDPDEPHYAETAREMSSSGDLILPHLNGGVYSEKPPLFFWLSMAASRIPGVPAGSGGRLLSVLASAATLLLTFRIGARIMGEATGTLAALILGTSLLYAQLSQSGVIDPLLTLCCTAAVHAFVRHRAGARGGMLEFYLWCAAGVLAKGPVGLLIPGLAAATYVILEEGAAGLRARHPLWGIPLAIAPAVLWLAAATIRGGAEYGVTLLVKQNAGRAFKAFVHREPLQYFVLVLPISFLPWTIFLPQAIVASLRERIGRYRPMLLPFAWFFSVFVFFSVISSKKTRYMLPLFPSAALLVAGWMIRRMLSHDGRLARGRIVLIAASIAGLALSGLLLSFVAGGVDALPAPLRLPLLRPGAEGALDSVRSALSMPDSLRVVVPAALFAGCCCWTIWLAWRRRGEAFPALFAGWTLLIGGASLLWVPVINEIKSARPLAEAIQAESKPGSLHYLRGIHGASLNFYLGVDRIPLLHKAEEVRAAAQEPEARFIGGRDDVERIGKRLGITFDLPACRLVGEVVLCLAAAPAPPSRG